MSPKCFPTTNLTCPPTFPTARVTLLPSLNSSHDSSCPGFSSRSALRGPCLAPPRHPRSPSPSLILFPLASLSVTLSATGFVRGSVIRMHLALSVSSTLVIAAPGLVRSSSSLLPSLATSFLSLAPPLTSPGLMDGPQLRSPQPAIVSGLRALCSRSLFLIVTYAFDKHV